MSRVHDSVKLRHGSAKIVLTIRYSQALWKHEDALGVSATHLDWTMVPYVSKSFYKHFKDGLKYILNINLDKFDTRMNSNLSIEDEEYKSYGSAYQYALDMTEREVHQSAEAMYHNLNTLCECEA